MKLFVAVLMATLAANACEVCTSELRAGISVTIVDGTTGGPLLEEHVTVTATEGTYTETVHPPILPGSPRTAGLVHERTGTYRVEVEATGYATWVASEVRVSETDDGCHVETVGLTARLEKEADG